MNYYILFIFFPVYYSFSKQLLLKKFILCCNKNHVFELENKTKKINTYKFDQGCDTRINDTESPNLFNLYKDLLNINLLKTLENPDISITSKLILISYYQTLNEYPIEYLSNLHAGGLMNDWDFI